MRSRARRRQHPAVHEQPVLTPPDATHREGLGDGVALDRRAHLLAPRRTQERDLSLQAGFLGLARKVRNARHILIRAVRARADEPGRDLVLPAVRLDRLAERREWSGEVWRERPVDRRLECRKVL
jgi:hypothetical protein